MGVLLRWLAAIGSIAAGSWVGLHAPADPSPAKPVATASSDESATSFEPARPHVETALAPGPVPWPRLNPEANITKAWRLAEGPHRKPGDKRRLVTLTFDDGPSTETTPRVLDLLAKYDVHASFFVIGRYLDGESAHARASRDVLRKVVEAGHLVGNHTHDHTLLTTVSHTQVLDQIDRGAASIEHAIGKKPLLFRPPFGELDDFGQDAVRTRQLDVVLWSAEVRDMERDDTDAMFGELVRQLVYNEGGIVLLHDIRPSSVAILKKLLVYLHARRWDPERPQRRGYEIVDLPTYLREVEAAPPQPGARDPKGLKRAAAKRRAVELNGV
ncbi:MAG TPA: polysaccharide deacetylase family protein [Labilithrix sp.]|nr:polysaccharide deacetylase family protein [Labilithrix sp.]